MRPWQRWMVRHQVYVSYVSGWMWGCALAWGLFFGNWVPGLCTLPFLLALDGTLYYSILQSDEKERQ